MATCENFGTTSSSSSSRRLGSTPTVSTTSPPTQTLTPIRCRKSPTSPHAGSEPSLACAVMPVTRISPVATTRAPKRHGRRRTVAAPPWRAPTRMTAASSEQDHRRPGPSEVLRQHRAQGEASVGTPDHDRHLGDRGRGSGHARAHQHPSGTPLPGAGGPQQGDEEEAADQHGHREIADDPGGHLGRPDQAWAPRAGRSGRRSCRCTTALVAHVDGERAFAHVPVMGVDDLPAHDHVRGRLDRAQVVGERARVARRRLDREAPSRRP